MDFSSMEEAVNTVAGELALSVGPGDDPAREVCLSTATNRDERLICAKYMGGGEAELRWGGNGMTMQLRVGSDEDLLKELRQLAAELLEERKAAAAG